MTTYDNYNSMDEHSFADHVAVMSTTSTPVVEAIARREAMAGSFVDCVLQTERGPVSLTVHERRNYTYLVWDVFPLALDELPADSDARENAGLRGDYCLKGTPRITPQWNHLEKWAQWILSNIIKWRNVKIQAAVWAVRNV